MPNLNAWRDARVADQGFLVVFLRATGFFTDDFLVAVFLGCFLTCLRCQQTVTVLRLAPLPVVTLRQF